MNATLSRGLAVASLLLWVSVVHAQPVMDSTPSAPPVPSSLRGASAFALPSGVAESIAPLKWGPVELKPHFNEKFTYSDGILFGPNHTTNTYVNSLSAGLLLDLGRHWTMDYTPTWMIYTNRIFNNSLDHHLNVVGGVEFGDWFAQFRQTYSSTNSPQIETASQVGVQVSSTSFNLSHRFNDHWSLEVGGTQNLQFIEKSPDFYDWSTDDWLTYRFAARLEISVGYREGYTDFDPGAYMIYSQPQARIRWRVSDKLTLTGQGGRQHRKVHKTGFAAVDTPTYNGSLQYQPFEHTTLTLGAVQSVSPSFFRNSVSESKGWNAEIDQRLLGILDLTAGYSEAKNRYSGSHIILVSTTTREDILDADGKVTGTLTTVSYSPTTVIDLRNDSTHSYHVRLSTPILGRGTFAVLYERKHNDSDQVGYSFTSHQVGCEVSYRF